MVDFLCQRYHCLPSQVLAEDAEIVRRLNLIAAAKAAAPARPSHANAVGDPGGFEVLV